MNVSGGVDAYVASTSLGLIDHVFARRAPGVGKCRPFGAGSGGLRKARDGIDVFANSFHADGHSRGTGASPMHPRLEPHAHERGAHAMFSATCRTPCATAGRSFPYRF